MSFYSFSTVLTEAPLRPFVILSKCRWFTHDLVPFPLTLRYYLFSPSLHNPSVSAQGPFPGGDPDTGDLDPLLSVRKEV